MPRPKSPDPRTETIAFRVTLAELVAARRLADANGMTTGAWVRALLAAAIKPRTGKRKGRTPTVPPRQRTITIIDPHRLDAPSYHLILRLGTNLNQIARHCNTYGYPPPPELAELLAEIRAVLAEAIPPRPVKGERKRRTKRTEAKAA